ncbi:up-regulator of cell proliferation-like [Phyllobates terribilis]|uniref:up-regulator of cell proliferation-like n=1 Tax=Phyllobates terribilis TaxID=111132 RepID=UPI003CCB0930
MSSKESLLKVFRKILQSNLASLEEEIETLLRYTLRHDAVEQMDDPRRKTEELLNILLDGGEDACQQFLEHLKKNPNLFPRILRLLSDTEADKVMFKMMLEDLGLGTFIQQKLSLSKVQSIICDERMSDASCNSTKDIPMHLLRHLMALNIQEAFRSFDFIHESSQSNSQQDSSGNVSGSVHPLDVLCGLLYCSDNFLRQDIIRRMSMCQVPVPLLLPAGEEENGTFLLWAMRSIIMESFSPSLVDHRALTEDSVVNISLPVFSFVSLGKSRCLSKAKVMKQILTSAQQRSKINCLHRVMDWGDMPNNISNGLVEIAWYFPAYQNDVNPLEKPFALANLHGDLQTNMRQFEFLTKVSSAVFILMENLTKQQWDLLLHVGGSDNNYYFIFQDQFNQESNQFCRRLFSDFGLNEQKFLMQSDKKLNEKLQFILRDTIQKSPKKMTLSDMSVEAEKLHFYSDENQHGCEYGRLYSKDLIDDIVSAMKYAAGDVKQLQNLKMEIVEIEKELCRLRHQEELCVADYKTELINKIYDLLKVQSQYNHSDIMVNLRYAFTYLNIVEQQYFLKWTQFQKFSANAILDNAIQEDVFSRIGWMYEAEVIVENTPEGVRLCANFPKAAADLLLQGIPVQLIDGDTSRIYLQWITDVLTELHTKTKGKCRIRVISVLGVQGTGKSTLLNNMFGLQFPVAHRQCTHGALMSLIKVEEKDLGCDYFVVIDCEGLRALHNASVEESFDHDNELATLMVGLSDIAIINMALGSTSEMQNILQIVIHALIRMKGNGQKPNCVLVYQTVDSASSGEESMIDREMLRIGAESSKFLEFYDAIDNFLPYNILTDDWIIPPYDLKTSCYSEKVVELKKHLLQLIKDMSQSGSFRNVQNFTEDMKILWNSVKHENYIFRFKNILEGNIYTELYEKFLEQEWNLCRKMSRWWANIKEDTSKHPASELHIHILVQKVLRMLNEEERMMKESLQIYFTANSEDTNIRIAKKFEAEFMDKIQSLRSKLETHYNIECSKIKILRSGLKDTILEDFTREEPDLHGTRFDAEHYWNEAVTKYKSMILRYDVEEEFLQLLRQDMRTKGSKITELIHGISHLSNYAAPSFTYGARYANRYGNVNMEKDPAYKSKRDSIAKFLLEKSNKYVRKMVTSKAEYNEVHGMNLLKMVNDVIHANTMPYTDLFTLNLKLQILAQSVPHFQKIQEDSLRKCATPYYENHLKGEVILCLKYVLRDKTIANNYCQVCLKPAVEVKVKKVLKHRLASDFTSCMCAERSRMRPSGGPRGQRCIHHPPVVDTPENICTRYTGQGEIQVLLANIISSVTEDIRKVLTHPDILKRGNIGDLLSALWSVLQVDMSGVRRDILKAPYSVTVSVAHWASYLVFFANKLEKQLQEEFRPKSIEEHYMECPYLIL